MPKVQETAARTRGQEGKLRMNKDIVKAVELQLSLARDNLERANRKFSGLSADGMRSEYGQSGESCSNILSGYQTDVKRWEAALAEAKR